MREKQRMGRQCTHYGDGDCLNEIFVIKPRDRTNTHDQCWSTSESSGTGDFLELLQHSPLEERLNSKPEDLGLKTDLLLEFL